MTKSCPIFKSAKSFISNFVNGLFLYLNCFWSKEFRASCYSWNDMELYYSAFGFDTILQHTPKIYHYKPRCPAQAQAWRFQLEKRSLHALLSIARNLKEQMGIRALAECVPYLATFIKVKKTCCIYLLFTRLMFGCELGTAVKQHVSHLECLNDIHQNIMKIKQFMRQANCHLR